MKKMEKYQVFSIIELIHMGYIIIRSTRTAAYTLLGKDDWRIGWCNCTNEVLHLYKL